MPRKMFQPQGSQFIAVNRDVAEDFSQGIRDRSNAEGLAFLDGVIDLKPKRKRCK